MMTPNQNTPVALVAALILYALILTLCLAAVTARETHTAHAASAPIVGRCDGPSVSRWSPLIVRAARTHRVPAAVLAGLVAVESGGNPRAVSPAGAEGLTQLLPSTAAAVGIANPFDPRQSLRGGARYLRQLVNYGYGLRFALAAYNAGPSGAERGLGWTYAAIVLSRSC